MPYNFQNWLSLGLSTVVDFLKALGFLRNMYYTPSSMPETSAWGRQDRMVVWELHYLKNHIYIYLHIYISIIVAVACFCFGQANTSGRAASRSLARSWIHTEQNLPWNFPPHLLFAWLWNQNTFRPTCDKQLGLVIFCRRSMGSASLEHQHMVSATRNLLFSRGRVKQGDTGETWQRYRGDAVPAASRIKMAKNPVVMVGSCRRLMGKAEQPSSADPQVISGLPI